MMHVLSKNLHHPSCHTLPMSSPCPPFPSHVACPLYELTSSFMSYITHVLSMSYPCPPFPSHDACPLYELATSFMSYITHVLFISSLSFTCCMSSMNLRHPSCHILPMSSPCPPFPSHDACPLYELATPFMSYITHVLSMSSHSFTCCMSSL